MINLNLKQVRQAIRIDGLTGEISSDWFFDFIDGSYGALLHTGTMTFNRTVKI